MPVRRMMLVLGCVSAVCCLACQTAQGQSTQASAPAEKTSRPADKAPVRIYAIVVSRKTSAEPKWREVVDALRKKHSGKVILYSKDVREAVTELSAWMPDYVCFVARPQETKRPFVFSIHNMIRMLDDDPYHDALWSILTGYDAAGALRIAKHAEPLVLRRAVTGTASISLKPFDSGLRVNEGKKGQMWTKSPGDEEKEGKCEPDCVKVLVDALNNTRPDCFFTSGHATTKDWQLGYRWEGGQFRCLAGLLYGIDTKGKKHLIKSPNPKVYLAVGNCLIGRIPNRDCMALAWMHSGGAYQMFAHTAPQWYGHMGWGMGDLLVNQPGRFNVVESAYFNQQSLLHRLRTEYPKFADVEITNYDNMRALQQALIRRNKGRRFKIERDLMGLLWERETTVLYGDPAWDARLKKRPLPWDQKFTVRDGVYTFTVTTNEDGKWPGGRKRPVTALLPRRVKDIEIIEGADLKPVVTDNFILIPRPAGGAFKKGERFKVVFRAKPLVRPRTKVLKELKDSKNAVSLLPESFRSAVLFALHKAGRNRGQLVAAIRGVHKDQRKAAAFLIANMPDCDLKTLSKEFLLDNIKYAFEARKKAPWSKRIPESLFYGHVLPYATVNERRDNWRKDFYERFSALAWKCKSPGEAAQLLNKEIFKRLDVKYHATKRPKPDQSPYESIEAKCASCTGLSILLVDACRAVGVPARLAGIPLWKADKDGKRPGRAGNHNWTEVWDGQWYHLGAAEPGPLNKAWFTKKCPTAADPQLWPHRIYAASFKKTGVSFPLVWDLSVQWVPATDVTRFYTAPRKVRFALHGEGRKDVAVYLLSGELIATAIGTDAVELPLAGGLAFDVVARGKGGRMIRQRLRVPPGRPTTRPEKEGQIP